MKPRLPRNNRGALAALTKEELTRLYFDEQLSQWQIAARFKVTQGAVLYWFRKWGLAARSHDDSLIVFGKSGRFTGPKNPRWNGGRHICGAGYAWVRLPGHRLTTKRGYVREHQLVWEQAHGTELPKGWHVHHKNGIKDDNRPENLEAMPHARHRDVLPALLRRIAALETRVTELEHALEYCTCRSRLAS